MIWKSIVCVCVRVVTRVNIKQPRLVMGISALGSNAENKEQGATQRRMFSRRTSRKEWRMDEFMNEDMKGNKWSSKEKKAKMINRKRERKK
jgi:hypothetical protein